MKNKQDNIISKKIEMPQYTELKQKYKCLNCKFQYNRYAKCYGKPKYRTQCLKRSLAVEIPFDILTGIIIVVAFMLIYSEVKDLLLSLGYIVIFMIGMDIICSLIESIVKKIFEEFENNRRKRYEKKVEKIEMLKRQQEKEEELKKEREIEIIEEIKQAKELFSKLSNEYYTNLKEVLNTHNQKGYGKVLLKNYKTFLKSLEELLEQINIYNFHLSEIKLLFHIHLPKLIEYIDIYIDTVLTNKDSNNQMVELLKLLGTFTQRIIWIKEHLEDAEEENFIYKMQALREIVHIEEIKEAEK